MRHEFIALKTRLHMAYRATVYGLFDEDGTLRYIGSTNSIAHQRWTGHCTRRSTALPVEKWVDGLRQAGKRPVIRVLERPCKTRLLQREHWWIAWAMGHGLELLNVNG